MMTVLQTIELDSQTPGISLKLEVLAEDCPVQGNVQCHDEDSDKAAEADVLAEWEHNNFCWCTLRVVAELAGSPEIYGDDFLGCVSILEKHLAEGETLEQQAKQFAEDHDMSTNAKAELQRAIAGVEQSIADFKGTV